ncbi:hypothetical protein KUL118_66690 [Tenacibaculum sp. KUL118]|nr:hypothetical protein KUL118_66690 [Tenacibaculum sp. KUL118]
MKNYKDILYSEIGKRIKSQRLELNMNQTSLAKALNSNELKISRASISNIEVGRHHIPLHVLYEIAQVLRLEINDLLPNYEELVNIVSSNLDVYSNIIEKKVLKDNTQKNVKELIKNL